MENNKLYARIAPPDYIDMDPYFDFKEAAAQGHLTVIHDDSRNYSGYKSPEWEELEKLVDTLSGELWDFENHIKSMFAEPAKSAREIFSYYIPDFKYSPRLVHRWKEAIHAWAENGMEDETACKLLELYTGKKWDYAGIWGSCQGDYATVYFPAISNETDRERYVDAISAYYFGTGAEIEIHDGENEPEDADEISGYWDYIPIPYPTEGEIKEYLSEQTGIEPDNITLYVPTLSYTSFRWEYEIA